MAIVAHLRSHSQAMVTGDVGQAGEAVLSEGIGRKRKRESIERVNQRTSAGEAVVESGEVDSSQRSEGMKWHYRLSHCSKRYLEMAARVMPELVGIKFGSDIMDCPSCKMAKAKRKYCSQRRHGSEQPFARLHSDLVGCLKPGAFMTNARYFVTFTDDATRYAFAYELADKRQVHTAFRSCLGDIRRLTGPSTKVAELRIDGELSTKLWP